MDFNPRNVILSHLEPAAAMRARGKIERVTLRRGGVLQEIGEPVDWVWFPDAALICVASENVDGESVSGGMVGWNGAYGAFEACGSRVSFTRAIVQIAGPAWRMRAGHYRELFDQSPALRTAVHKHIEALMVEARQLVACAAIHPVENRMCRALLDASERSHGGPVLSLTQEALANMLGVQRPTVAVTASSLQRRGLIRTRRGVIELLDRRGLQQLCCSCRETIAYAEAEIVRSEAHVCEA
ncbi:Crp/Fnr family transcriptional regulator [Phenylobacterium terrae]|uniref:Crp/Fnr family transcriptional regulator n=1 Tax=Phenylobacterium terrae TaxID=2665495 RepID=A0ABW4N5X9_9CAUL